MGKLTILLREGRTVPVADELVELVTKLYQTSYFKFISAFLDYQIEKAEMAQGSEEQAEKLAAFRQLLSQTLKEPPDGTFPKGAAYDMNFAGNTQLFDQLEHDAISFLAATLPSSYFVNYFTSDPVVLGMVRDRFSSEELRRSIRDFLLSKNILRFAFKFEIPGPNGELISSKKKFSALYHNKTLTITLLIPRSVFHDGIEKADKEEGRKNDEPYSGVLSNILDYSDLKRVRNEIVKPLHNFKINVRHELQHLTQHILPVIMRGNKVFGLGPKAIVRGIPTHGMVRNADGEVEDYIDPKTGIAIDYDLIPIETPTNLQDNIELFQRDFKRFTSIRDLSPEETRLALKALFKIFIDSPSSLGADEEHFMEDNGGIKNHHQSLFFKNIKEQNPALWRWAVKKFFDDIRDLL